MIAELWKQAAQTSPLALTGICAGSEGYVLARLTGGAPATIVHISSSERDMRRARLLCSYFAPQLKTLAFPAWDCLPYDRVSPAHAVVAERLETLSALASAAQKPSLIFTTVHAVMQRVPPRDVLAQSSFMLAPGKTLSRDAFLHFLLQHGYRRTGKVAEVGEYAVRGSIIDLFPPGGEMGLRIDLFGDEIESLRWFDPLTQTSGAAAEVLTLHPVSEVPLHEAAIEQFRSQYREQFGAVTKHDPLYEAISEGRHYAGMEHWLPLFYPQLGTLLDYVPDAVLAFDQNEEHTRRDRYEMLEDYYQARAAQPHSKLAAAMPIYHPLPTQALYILNEEWQKRARSFKQLHFTAFDKAAMPSVAFTVRPSPNFYTKRLTNDQSPLETACRRILQSATPVLIACQSQGTMERLRALLSEHAVHAKIVENGATPSGISIGVLPIEQGFETQDLLVLSEQDLLGERLLRTQTKRRKSDVFMAEAANFLPGELVVHQDHGIGRFEGLITVEVNNAKHDCLKIVYAGGDKLFIPVENIDVLSRYGSDDESTELDALGSASWQSRKAKLKQRIKLAAEALLKVAAERKLRAGISLTSPPGFYEEFAARFPYEPTEDQQRSIDEVLADMASGQPMDRLVCGDVGFGKTEVALRAAYVATSDPAQKVQVAVLAPTTLLARQHYINFTQRFEGLPVTIRQMSRLVPAREMKETKEALAKGEIDIIIGTHALLGSQVEFQNLGLLIVDEEQHFGVAQKEKLKALKANIHVLSLSATPIPRTLQMALSGVRELSLITQAPVDRLAIRSFVLPLDPVVIREAILRELHRGGKVFYVTPRIEYMAELNVMLRELVPEAKLVAAHGQMPPKQLDTIMNDFYQGKYDLLLCTAIIESGLDIPTANTMIIDRADRFGLSQLYQLRGRVGRGKLRAYAYFTLPHHHMLTPQALKRLEVMQTLDTLGAGFSVASHDMDIRGFGNLLGEEQSGHVREVGVELYQQMLEEAVAAVRSGEHETARADEGWSPQINLGVAVLIPDSYVDDLSLRLGLYRRLAHLHTEQEIEQMAAEMIDRFGPLPAEVEHLMHVLRIKALCRHAGIERVDAGPKGITLSFRGNRFANPDGLIKLVQQHSKTLKIRADQKLVLMGEIKDATTTFKATRQFVASLCALVPPKADKASHAA